MNNQDVKTMVESVESTFNAAVKVLDGMQDGQRVQLKDLAEKVAQELNTDVKSVLPFVTHFAHNSNLAYVTRGKNGGLVKGTRPVKEVKEPKAKKADVAVTEDVQSQPEGSTEQSTEQLEPVVDAPVTEVSTEDNHPENVNPDPNPNAQ